MAMNREQRRYLQRQGQMDSDGNPIATKRERSNEQRQVSSERTGFRQYLSEVRAEMGRVIWPTRSELINYTGVVIVTFVIVTGLIAFLDWAFAEGFLALLRSGTSAGS